MDSHTIQERLIVDFLSDPRHRKGWNEAIHAAANHLESKKPGGALDIVVQGFADEVRSLIRNT